MLTKILKNIFFCIAIEGNYHGYFSVHSEKQIWCTVLFLGKTTIIVGKQSTCKMWFN